jgi:predicted MPP superfamily phosphohydrolase
LGLFLLTFFLIYGGFHYYFFLKLRAAFAPGAVVQMIVIALLILGLMTPVIVRASERYGMEMTARLVSWTGYLWMAFILIYIFSSLLLEGCRLLTFLSGLVFRIDAGPFLPSAWTFFLLPAAVAIGIVIYGAFDARCIRTEYLPIHSPKIPKDAGKIRMVQISDVHIGIIVRNGYLSDILRAVREADPDILVSTGDLVDGQGDNLAEAVAQLRGINPRYGKFAVTGNHEFYAGIDKTTKFTENAGFKMLRGEVASVAGIVDLVGIDDPGHRRSDRKGESLSLRDSNHYTILLKHQPVVARDALGAFDLQLSGHTHGGQIFPFSLLTRSAFPFHAGSYRLSGGALLHVSRGAGTWGPPVRFLSPPEITVIDLMPKEPQQKSP